MSGFDFDKRWPELFEGLDAEQQLRARNNLAASWHEGFAISRDDVADLVALVKGEISGDEYHRRTLERLAGDGEC